MKVTKKIFFILLSFCIVIGFTSISTFAEEGKCKNNTGVTNRRYHCEKSGEIFHDSDWHLETKDYSSKLLEIDYTIAHIEVARTRTEALSKFQGQVNDDFEVVSINCKAENESLVDYVLETNWIITEKVKKSTVQYIDLYRLCYDEYYVGIQYSDKDEIGRNNKYELKESTPTSKTELREGRKEVIKKNKGENKKK